METEINFKITNLSDLQIAKYKLQEIEEELTQADKNRIGKDFNKKYKDQWIKYYNKDNDRYEIMKARKLISINSSKTVNGYRLELLIEKNSFFSYKLDTEKSEKAKQLIASSFTYDAEWIRNFVYSDCIEVISNDEMMKIMWDLTGYMSQWLQNANLAKEVRDHFNKRKA